MNNKGLLIGQKGVQYGLIKTGPKKPGGPNAPAKPLNNVFGADSDSDDDVGAQVARQAERKISDKKIIQMQEDALKEDANAFAYDEVYDDMQQSKAVPKHEEKVTRKPKYILQLLEHAETRKREQDLAYERVQVRDRQKEDHLYEDKEKFVTSAYRRKLEEDAKWKAEEKAREEEEKRNDPRNLGHMRNFYSNLLTKNVSYGKVDGGKGVGDKGKEQMDQKEPSPPAAATTSNVPPKPNAPQIELDAYEKLRLEAERALREKKAAEAAGGAGASNGEQEVRREDGGQGSERDERAGASGQVSTSQPRGSVEAVGEGRPVVDGTGTVQDSALHAGKRRNDDTSVVSARERYLARKQQRTG